MTDHVSSESDGPVTTITMDDGKVNALSPSMQESITAHLLEAEQNGDIRAIVLAGRPGVFSAGYDLKVMGSGEMAAIVSMVASGGDLVRRIYGLSKPVVAAVTGHAIAGGALTLLGCDVRVGTTDDVKIGMNEVAIGMALPEWGITICSHRLNSRHQNRSLVNARLTSSAQAIDVGFLDSAVEGGKVIDTAIEEARTLSELDLGAYAEMVKRFRGAVLDEMAAEIAADRASV